MATSRSNMDKTSTYSNGSDLIYEVICIPCHHDGIDKPAHGYCVDCKEHLCVSCYTYHRRAAPCRHHTLQDIDTMPTTQQIPDTTTQQIPDTTTQQIPDTTTQQIPNTTTTDDKLSDKLTSPCPQHDGKVQELYCKDHGALLCTICVALKHKSCKVDYIPDISDQYIDSTILQDTIDSIDKQMEDCETLKKDIVEDTKTSDTSLEQALTDVRKYRKDINTRIDHLEEEIQHKIQELKDHNVQQVTTAETKCEDILKISKLRKDSMKQKNSSRLSNNLFTEIKQAQEMIQEFEDGIATITSQASSIYSYKFIPRPILHSQSMIGDIKRFTIIKPKSPSEIYVDTSQDTITCWITDIIEVSPGKLVLCDYNNDSIKLVDTDTKTVTSQLKLDTLCNVTKTCDTTVAVTLPQSRIIQFVSVSNELKLINKIKTRRECWGICYHENKIIFTYKNPGAVEILDKNGTVMKTITKDIKGVDIFEYPEYVVADSRYIYVSDSNKEEIIMLNYNGDIIARCGDFRYPKGLVVLNDESLLVCDISDSTVYELSRDLTKKKVILNDISKPRAICVSGRRDRLYISKAYQNNIYTWNI